MNTAPTVHVVHCIDTEGPLHESLAATFGRLEHSFGIRLDPTPENLRAVRQGALDLGGWEQAASRMVAPELLDYLDTWERIDEMLATVMDPAWRARLADSGGDPWVCNWFCMDHVGFSANPRRRVLGYHAIFDHYAGWLSRRPELGDALHFHFHPVPISGQAHHRATSLFANADTLFQVLARRIIDRGWFPCAFRPGFNATRPDGHWFLEQYIPFDFANQAQADADGSQPDRATGRFVDWRRAPASWTPYHPSHDDHQVPGSCRRFIARCLNIGTRARNLTQDEVDQAFAQAAQGHPVVLAFTNHDFRDIRPAMEAVQEMLERAETRHPDVDFVHCEARRAMRSAMGLEPPGPLRFDLRWDGPVLHIRAVRPLFGPQPFLALHLADGRYATDNLDVTEPGLAYSYTFDAETVPLDELARVGVAACDATGAVGVALAAPGSDETEHHAW